MEFRMEDINLVCRTCLQESTILTSPMTSIFNVLKTNVAEIQIIDMILVCSSVQLADSDTLPQFICHECINKLNTAFEFRTQIEQSQNLLQKWLLQSTIINKNIVNKTSYRHETADEILLQKSYTNKIDDPSQMDQQKISNSSMVMQQQTIKSEQPKQNNGIYLELLPDEINSTKCQDALLCKDLESHTNINQNVKSKVECKICKKTFCNSKYLETHMDKQHNSDKLLKLNDPINPYGCSICHQSYTNHDDVINHIATHTQIILNKLECPVCQKIFSGKSKLNKHLINKHYVRADQNVFKPHQCDNCDKAYTTLANLTLHKATHSGIKPFKCEICSRGFYKKNSLTTHMAIHTGIRSHLCSECGRSFTSANILQQHKKTHSNVRPYTCTVCLKGFHTSNDLRVHFRTHTGERPFLCSTCGRGFSRVTHLNIHLRTHSGEKPYICITCHKAFAQSGDLKAHVRTHTGEKPYCCKICNKRFNQSSGLTSHLKCHTGERNYSCDMCHKSFTQSSSLARHVKSHR